MSPIRMSGFVPLIGYIYRYIASFCLHAQCRAPVTGQPSSFHILMFLSIRGCKLSRKLPPKFLRRRSGAVGAPIRHSTSVHLFTFEQTRVWSLFLFHWCELMYNSEFRKTKVTAKMFRLDPYGAELKGQKSTEINTCWGFRRRASERLSLICRWWRWLALLHTDAIFEGSSAFAFPRLFTRVWLKDSMDRVERKIR